MKVSINFLNDIPDSWNEIPEGDPILISNIFIFDTDEQYNFFCQHYLEYRLKNNVLVFEEGNIGKSRYEMEQQKKKSEKQIQFLKDQIVEEQIHDLLISKGFISDSIPSKLDTLLIADQLLKDIANKEITIYTNVTTSVFQNAVLEVPTEITQDWEPGQQYKKGQLRKKNEVKYLFMVDHLSQAHQPPDMPNGAMLSVAKPFQDRGRRSWIYGEYSVRNDERIDPNGSVYQLNAENAGANIYPPSQVPALWKKIS